MKKILLSLIFSWILLFSVSIVSEAEETVIMISTPEELDAIRENLSGHYQLANDIDMKGYYDMEPIGGEAEGAFTGTLDGNGYVIKNLDLDYEFYKYVGLFGYLDGTVQNVTLENVLIVGSRYVGGIAGYATENSMITGCEVSGSIEGGSEYFVSCVAGITGQSFGILNGCINNANIKSIQKSTVVAGIAVAAVMISDCDNTGNLSGVIEAYGIGTADTMQYCSNSGEVISSTSSSSRSSSDTYAYGIGKAEISIQHCSNSGDISAFSDSFYYASGCNAYGIGEADVIQYCSNSGEISSHFRHDNGYAYGIGEAETSIQYCSNNGDIISYFSAKSDDRPGSYIGGIGEADVIQYCSNSGTLSTANYHDYSCTVYGIGRAEIIEKCSNRGDVSVSADYYWVYDIGTGRVITSYSFSNNIISLEGQNYAFDKTKGRDVFEELVSSDMLNQLDYKTIYVRDKNWSSGLPMLRNMPSDLELNEVYLFLYSGENAQLKGRIDGVEVSDLTFTSSNENAVKVSSTGFVTAQGDANDYSVISVRTADGHRMNCRVYVYSRKPESVSIISAPVALSLGQTVQLGADIEYDMATEDLGLTWTSSDESIATVSDDGVVEAKGLGTVTITVMTENGKKATCTIKVAGEPILNETEMIIGAGKTKTLTATVLPEGSTDTVTFSSSNTSIATVNSSGTITAKNAGTCVITATTSSGTTAQCQVTVTNLALNSTATVNVEKTLQLVPTLSPAGVEQTVTWSSNNESVVIVDEQGVISGISAGTATVTATSEYGITKSCVVTVTNYANGMMLERNAITMEKGATDMLGVILNPVNAVDTITYTSSNTSVVTVSSTGLVTAKATGTAQITVRTSKGLVQYCSVVVVNKSVPATDMTLNQSQVTLYPEQTQILTATLTPSNTTTNKITWSSSDESVATVNQGGMVTAVGKGKATITAALSNGIYRTCDVTVKAYSFASVEVKDTIACAGDIVSVPFEIKENAGIASMRLNIGYDSEILTPVGVTAGDILSGAQLEGNVDEDGSYYVLWSQASNVTGNGKMFTVDFEIAENAEPGINTAITVTSSTGDICDEAHNDIGVTFVSGEISVKTLLLGDVYVDQMLNSHDILLLQQYMTELVTLDARQMKRADMNSDGNVTMQDVVLLAQTLVNPSAFSQPAAMAVLNLLSETYEPFAINLGSVELNDKGYAEVPVSFENCPGISAFKFKINYNAEEIELEEVSAAGEVFLGNLMSNLENASSGEAVVTWYSNKNVVPNGAVMTLRFVAKTDELTNASVITMTTTEGDLCDEACNSVSVAINDGAVLPKEPEVKTPVTEIFTDLKAGSWYVDAVQYVYDLGIMSGNNGLFKPTDNITRAQVVMTLYNLEGKPVVTDYSAIDELVDLKVGQWYTDAVCWAYNTGITTGNNTTHMFNMGDNITRQQLATFFYRYAEYKGLDVSASADISAMVGADNVATYALKQVEWAVGAGLIKGSEIVGSDGIIIFDLKPTGTATRAQVATIIQRFSEGTK